MPDPTDDKETEENGIAGTTGDSKDPSTSFSDTAIKFRASSSIQKAMESLTANSAYAKMMEEMGVPVTALGVAQHYCARYPGLVDYFVIDESDAGMAREINELGVEATAAPTVMKTLEDKQQLARFVLQLGPKH